MLDHFFISSCDGALHDTRKPDWSAKPLRPNYSRHHGTIKTAADFKATLRAGPYTRPGGYPLYFQCADGGTLCFKCAQKDAREVIAELLRKLQPRNDWRVVGCDVNWEDGALQCDGCNRDIEAAYTGE